MWKTVGVNITYPSADCRKTWPKISITSMRKFADFTFHILKCREGPSFIHLVMSAMFIWTYSYVSFSSNSFFFYAWSACVTLWSVNILSCQFQSSLRTSKKIVTLSFPFLAAFAIWWTQTNYPPYQRYVEGDLRAIIPRCWGVFVLTKVPAV